MVAVLGAVISVAVVVALSFIVIKFVMAVRDFRKLCYAFRQFPHKKGNFIWGNLFEYPGPDDRGLKFQRDMTTEFPRVLTAWMGPSFPMLIVNHPETVRIILRTSEPKAHRIYHLLEPWIGDGLLLSKGQKWGRNRRLLTPAFHFDILKPYLAIKNKAADILLEKFQGCHDRGEYFEVFNDISMFTLDVILKCAFSYDTDCQRLGYQHPYVKAVFALSEMAVKRFFQPWFHSDWLYFLTPTGRRFLKCCRQVHAVAEEVIQKRKEALAKGSQPAAEEQSRRRRCLDFLDILLTARDENNEGLRPDEIRAEVDTFLFEGHDTTASAIAWAMYSLAEHPDIQTRCQREVDELLDGRETDDVLWEDFNRMPYLTMCLKEAMRLHTPVPFIQRQLTQDTLIDGHTAPAGTIVNIVIYNIHHNPVVWEESMEYRPERFTEENCNARNPYAFIPFSAGPRNCIGQTFAMHEIKLVMAKMLRRYTLELDPNHKVEKFESVVMKTKTGIRMKATPRQPAGQKY
ncbi:ultra-long-chain fatty acid omega-hydroxylase-like [Babylonia areolata]|uniref:ultra-long-chain fatty acid omega-hydroxylase-like n=1 Tax=Babylonia areolata TaxID=304850 RepID=UPI003FD35FF4